MGSLYLEIGDPPGSRGTFKIKLESVNMGTQRNQRQGRRGEREPEVPNIQDLIVSRKADNHSPEIFRRSFQGQPEVMRIYFYDDKAKTKYLTLKLDGALIAGVNISSGGDRPMESLTINFTKIEYKYEPGYLDENEYRPAYDLSVAKGS